MEKLKKIGSEITVRISLTFQDAPDVHTLLAMTPARERGKLVRLALQRYIAATDHPAGNIDAQIDAISRWLRNRAPVHAADLIPSCELLPTGAIPTDTNRKQPIAPTLPTDALAQRLGAETEKDGATTTADGFESPSMRRWLTD